MFLPSKPFTINNIKTPFAEPSDVQPHDLPVASAKNENVAKNGEVTAKKERFASTAAQNECDGDSIASGSVRSLSMAHQGQVSISRSVERRSKSKTPSGSILPTPDRGSTYSDKSTSRGHTRENIRDNRDDKWDRGSTYSDKSTSRGHARESRDDKYEYRKDNNCKRKSKGKGNTKGDGRKSISESPQPLPKRECSSEFPPLASILPSSSGSDTAKNSSGQMHEQQDFSWPAPPVAKVDPRPPAENEISLSESPDGQISSTQQDIPPASGEQDLGEPAQDQISSTEQVIRPGMLSPWNPALRSEQAAVERVPSTSPNEDEFHSIQDEEEHYHSPDRDILEGEGGLKMSNNTIQHTGLYLLAF